MNEYDASDSIADATTVAITGSVSAPADSNQWRLASLHFTDQTIEAMRIFGEKLAVAQDAFTRFSAAIMGIPPELIGTFPASSSDEPDAPEPPPIGVPRRRPPRLSASERHQFSDPSLPIIRANRRGVQYLKRR